MNTTDINPVWHLMTKEEQETHFIYSMSGMHQYDQEGNLTVYMGIQALKRYQDYVKSMVEKYEPIRLKIVHKALNIITAKNRKRIRPIDNHPNPYWRKKHRNR